MADVEREEMNDGPLENFFKTTEEADVRKFLETAPFYNNVDNYVRKYMARYDPSHDYSHIQRVLSLACHILAKESRSNLASGKVNGWLVILVALLHDVGDRKYLKPGQSAEQTIRDALSESGVPKEFWKSVQTIVPNVSYSHEVQHSQTVEKVIEAYPELAIVQDADRLDAIGAVGIARTFAFGGAKAPDRGLQGCVDHFSDKLEKLEGMMKTETGKQIARERTRRLVEFRGWWEEETKLSL